MDNILLFFPLIEFKDFLIKDDHFEPKLKIY